MALSMIDGHDDAVLGTEMSLASGDLISRSALIERILHDAACFDKIIAEAGQTSKESARRDKEVLLALVQYLNVSPAVDAVEVVRCGECKRCGFCGDATNLEVMGFYGYCSRGKRRAGER